MFELVNDAEAAEGQAGEVTFKQMLDGAVLRARREFRAQPQLQGELLSELGRMYTRLGAGDAAVAVLEESIRVLEGKVRADDAALNKSRVFLAGALLEGSGDTTRIAALARATRTACANDSVDCFKARGYASNLLSQLAASAGDQATALAEMRRCATEIERGFGARHEETAMAFTSLATVARNAGEVDEAGAAMAKALHAAQGLRLRVADRVLLERTMAVIDHDLGRFAAARDRLSALLGQDLLLAERALLSRILANVYVELNDGESALRSADSALALATQGAADELPFALQARARALALQGSPEAALREIDAAIRLFAEGGRGPESFELLRAQRFRAQFLLMSHADAEALLALRELEARHEAAPVSAVEKGFMLDLLAEAESRAGNTAVALRGRLK
jgi:serine/threonine-protein kinase